MRIGTAFAATTVAVVSLLGSTGTATALQAAPQQAPAAQPAAKSACGPKVQFKNPAVNAVLRVCNKGKRVTGTVTDPKVDGKCASVRGKLASGRTLNSSGRACGKGKTVPVNLQAPGGERFKSFALQTPKGNDR
ncbi:hypothetical protein [Streptomyces sp. ODS28]|uniref:hypothetical protein n=1 Tax=Streptomyces sp. ODS28 TaxID=3136688 RepID=UPI0031EE1779